MKDFRLYDITDFVLDEDFIRWVQSKSPEDELFWNNWLRQHPEKHLAVAEARRIIESIAIQPTTIPTDVINEEIAKLFETIHTKPAPKAKVVGMQNRWWYAAAIVFVCSTGAFYLLQKPKPRKFVYAAMIQAQQLIEKVNTTAKNIVINLPDGSQLTLAPNSRVSYPRSFDSSRTRDIYLLGEAYFKVVKRPDRPFRVFANEIVTKVLGTSFTVRAFEADTAIRVIVRTGKVSVYTQGDKPAIDEIILTPNQQLLYAKADHKFQKVLLQDPRVIAPVIVEQYEDAPLEKVFNDLSKAYGINIVCDAEVMAQCTVTADLKNEPFYRKLDLICSAIGARYELIDGQVVIQSAGC